MKTAAILASMVALAGAAALGAASNGEALISQASKSPDQIQQSAATREAQAHFRVAQEALRNADLPTAEDELKKAADLAPRNAQIFYSLAVAQSKRDESQQAMENLKLALRLGLPAHFKQPAEDLRAELTYKLEKKDEQQQREQEMQARLGSISWLSGLWRLERNKKLPKDVCGTATYGDFATLYLSPDEASGLLVGTLDYTYQRTNFGLVAGGCVPEIRKKSISFKIFVGQKDQFKLDASWAGSATDTFMVRQFLDCSGELCNDSTTNSFNLTSIVIKKDDGFELPQMAFPPMGPVFFHR
jgi:hypothetical protein